LLGRGGLPRRRLPRRPRGALLGGGLATVHALAATPATALARRLLAVRLGRSSGGWGRGLRRRARGGGFAFGHGPRLARPALATAAGLATAAAPASAALFVRGALLARLAEDLADAFFFPVIGRALAPGPRQRDQQFRGYRLDRDLLLDVGLDVRQRHRVALAGEADRVALGAQPRGAADAVHVVLGVERQVVVVDVLHAVDVQAARGHVGRDQDLELP